MSDKMKGTAAGVALSLVAVGLWVLLSFIGIIAGLAGALMGILFTVAYRAVNKNDKSKYVIFAACVVIVIEIIVSELLVIAIIAGNAGVSLADALSIDEVKTAVILDVVIGLLLSFLIFGGHLFTSARKGKMDNRRIYTRPAEPEQSQSSVGAETAADPFETERNQSQDAGSVLPPPQTPQD